MDVERFYVLFWKVHNCSNAPEQWTKGIEGNRGFCLARFWWILPQFTMHWQQWRGHLGSYLPNDLSNVQSAISSTWRLVERTSLDQTGVWISCSVLETYIKDMGQLARGWLQKEWPFIDRQISMLANVHECPKVLHLMTGLCSPHYMTVSYISTATKLMLWLFHHKKQFAVDITWFNGLFIYITSSSQNIFCWNNLQFFLRFVVEIIF